MAHRSPRSVAACRSLTVMRRSSGHADPLDMTSAFLVATTVVDASTILPARRRPRQASQRSEPRVDRLGLQGQDGEDAFVDAPERLAARDAVQGLQAQGVLAERQRALVAEA